MGGSGVTLMTLVVSQSSFLRLAMFQLPLIMSGSGRSIWVQWTEETPVPRYCLRPIDQYLFGEYQSIVSGRSSC